MPGPLSGIRIIDLTTMVAGPVATMILADQGADVIKIESPGGDLMRAYGSIKNGMSSSFLSCNRGKRSVALDLKTPQGLEIVQKLVRKADVLVQNFRPGTIERIGLGEEAVRKLRPDLVYVSISGFGDSGPYADRRAYDPVIQALSGLAEIQADRDTGRPRMVRTIIPDCTTAVTAAQAISAALFSRERTCQGEHIRISMLDTMIAYLWPEAISGLSFVGSEVDPAKSQMGLDLVFKTRDRYITAVAISDTEWAGLCRSIRRPDLIDDRRFSTASARSTNRSEWRSIVSSELLNWTADQILSRFQQEQVPCAPILSRREVLDDAQVVQSQIIEIHEDERLGRVRQPRHAIRFDRTPVVARNLAPYLGADYAAVLLELDYSPMEIESFRSDGILFQESGISAMEPRESSLDQLTTSVIGSQRGLAVKA